MAWILFKRMCALFLYSLRADRFASIEIAHGIKMLAHRRVVMDDVTNEVTNNIIQLYLQNEEPHESSDAMRFFLKTNKM